MGGKTVKKKAQPRANGKTPSTELTRLRQELDMDASTWAPVPLEPILAGERTSDPPDILPRDDGVCLLYSGLVHSLYGEPEAGKGWVTLQACAKQLDAGKRVVYYDFEDEAEAIVQRLLDLGVESDAIADHFCYVRPDESLRRSELSKAELEGAMHPIPSLVVIDGMTEALALENVDLNDNTEVAKWIQELPRRLAKLGCAVLIIDHQTKDREGGRRFAIGAQHKLAGIHVAYSIKALKQFGRGVSGKSAISVEKDRPGHVRKHADNRVIAEVRFRSGDGGAMAVELRSKSEGFRPTGKMEEISVYLEEHGDQGLRDIVRWVEGREQTLVDAIRLLREDGFIEVTSEGKGKRTWHKSLKPYRAPSEEDE